MRAHSRPEITTRHRVLTVGLDFVLVQTRAALLSKRYDTDVCKPDEALQKLRAEAFSLLLVCYSIPHEDASSLIRQAHDAFPHLCIVRLLTVSSPMIQTPIAHKLVTIDYRPESWLKAVDDLLSA